MRAEVQPGVWLDSRRALFFAEYSLLVVADLHWGFARTHRVAGNLLPLWGDELIAHQLRALLADYRPAEMLWLGDCLHAVSGKAGAEAFLDALSGSGVKVEVLLGNHDKRWARPGCRTLCRGEFLFHHGDKEVSLAPGQVEVIGHFHPAANLRDGAGLRLRLPALVIGPRRLILPAFSPWASGVPWNDRLEPAEKLWAIAPSRILAVRAAQRRAQAPSP